MNSFRRTCLTSFPSGLSLAVPHENLVASSRDLWHLRFAALVTHAPRETRLRPRERARNFFHEAPTAELGLGHYCRRNTDLLQGTDQSICGRSIEIPSHPHTIWRILGDRSRVPVLFQSLSQSIGILADIKAPHLDVESFRCRSRDRHEGGDRGYTRRRLGRHGPPRGGLGGSIRWSNDGNIPTRICGYVTSGVGPVGSDSRHPGPASRERTRSNHASLRQYRTKR